MIDNNRAKGPSFKRALIVPILVSFAHNIHTHLLNKTFTLIVTSFNILSHGATQCRRKPVPRFSHWHTTKNGLFSSIRHRSFSIFSIGSTVDAHEQQRAFSTFKRIIYHST